MTDQIPAAGTLDDKRRHLKQILAVTEVVDPDSADDIRGALDDNAAAKEALLRADAERVASAAAARKAAAEAAADGDPDAAAKTAPKGRTAAPKGTTAAAPADAKAPGGAAAQGK